MRDLALVGLRYLGGTGRLPIPFQYIEYIEYIELFYVEVFLDVCCSARGRRKAGEEARKVLGCTHLGEYFYSEY